MERIGLACGRVDNHWRGAFDTPSLAFARGDEPAVSNRDADRRHAFCIAWTCRCFRPSDWDGVCRYFLVRTLLTPAIGTKTEPLDFELFPVGWSALTCEWRVMGCRHPGQNGVARICRSRERQGIIGGGKRRPRFRGNNFTNDSRVIMGAARLAALFFACYRGSGGKATRHSAG